MPRYRWDQLLVLAWRTYLPLVLAGVFFITLIFVSVFYVPEDAISINKLFIFLVCYKRPHTALKKNCINKVHFRTMFTPKRSLELLSKTTYNVLSKRPYAVATGNKPEMPSAKSDPQGLINNPEIGPNKVRHVEKHVQTCVEDPECKIKSCTTVCGTPGDRFASLLLTHGKNNPATPQGPMKTLSNKDYKGNNYVQKAVFYNKATKTAATTEDTQATAYLNRPDIKAKTEPYENIP